MVFSGAEQFLITCVCLYVFYIVIAPFIAVIFLGFLFLAIMATYTIYVFFIRVPFRAFWLWRDGKIESAYTRHKKLWFQTYTWKQWFTACIKSDIETLKLVINF